MNNNELAHRLSTLSACTLAAAFFFVTTAASAQAVSAGAAQSGTSSTSSTAAASAVDAAAAKPTSTRPQTGVEEEETYSFPLQIGDATSNLFVWQRSGEVGSKTPRPIAGSVASRSYERYLKSFEHPIPEHFSSSVKSSSGGGTTSGR